MFRPEIILSLLIPFIGTCLGAACVFLSRRELSTGTQKALTGFASGVMVAASVWSLLLPAMEMSAPMGKLAFMPAVIGFWVGTLFLLLLDRIIPHLHLDTEKAEGLPSRLSRTTMMVLAVTLHNIPEGMAVGVMLAGLAEGASHVTIGGALALSLGIAIQNFPEGAIISMPLFANGKSRPYAFMGGVLSGVVEPIAAGLAILVTYFVSTILPFTLAFAAGAMIYVVAEELIPEANRGEHSNLATIGLAAGFVLMMILDVALG